MLEADRDDRARSERMLGWIGPVMSPVALCYAALQAFHYDSWLAAVALVGTAAGLASTPWVGRLGLSRYAWVSAHTLLGMVIVSYFRGGVVWGILAFAIAPSLMGALMSRYREAVVAGGGAAALVIVLGVLERAGLTPPRVETSLVGLLTGSIGGLVSLTTLVILQERIRLRGEAERDAMRVRLSEASKAESVARLAGGVAHDFNNLLAVVLGHARTVREELGPSHPCQEDLKAIERAASAGAGITRRLLAVAREQPSERTPIDLGSFVGDLCKLLERVMPADVVIGKDVAEGVVVEADPWQLHQVVLNLVINARDAMPEGGLLTLTVSEHASDEPTELRFGSLGPGEYAVLEVSDAGEGMPEEVLARYVEPFFTTKKDGGGSGLGGSLVHGIAVSLGGGVDIESELGRGTRIKVFVPRSFAEPVSIEEPSYAEPAGPLVVLLVEDDPMVLKAMRRLIRLDGHEVLSASSGSRALELLREHADRVDVVLTDVSMPGMTGPELVRRMRGEHPRLPVIFLSGYAGGALESEDLADDQIKFLQKPASRGALRLAFESIRAA